MTMHDPPVRRAVGRSSKTPRIFTIFDLDQFLLATKDTQNQEVVRTLKLMNANHNRQAKDLQRRVAKATAALAAVAAAEAAAAATSLTNQQKLSSRNRLDGNVPQNSVDSPTSSAPSSRRRGPSSLQEQGNSGGLGQRRHNVPSQQSLDQAAAAVLSEGIPLGQEDLILARLLRLQAIHPRPSSKNRSPSSRIMWYGYSPQFDVQSQFC